MTRPLISIGVAAVFWAASPAAAPAQAPGNDHEIREAVIYHDGQHLFLAARPRLSTNGRFLIAGDSSAPAAPAEPIARPAAGPASDTPMTAVSPEDNASQDSAWERTPLEYIALGLLFFIALWAIAYRPDRSNRGGPTKRDRAEALDARLTYMDQRIADIERKVRRPGHHHKVA